MPLVKYVATVVPAQEAVQHAPEMVPVTSPVAPVSQAVTFKPVYAGRKNVDEPMTKDDYWRRREERDIETGIRIRRSGVWQAAIQSVGVLQYSPDVRTFADYLEAVAKAANAGLGFVEDAK